MELSHTQYFAFDSIALIYFHVNIYPSTAFVCYILWSLFVAYISDLHKWFFFYLNSLKEAFPPFLSSFIRAVPLFFAFLFLIFYRSILIHLWAWWLPEELVNDSDSGPQPLEIQIHLIEASHKNLYTVKRSQVIHLWWRWADTLRITFLPKYRILQMCFHSFSILSVFHPLESLALFWEEHKRSASRYQKSREKDLVLTDS